jgi:outer membrane protein OmpA-like peptidoglycan-associated protein
MVAKTLVRRSGPVLDGQEMVKQKGQRNRLAVVASIVLLSTSLAACESSQLLDVSGLLSSQPDKTDTTTATPNDTGTKAQAKEVTATGEAGADEKTVVRGPVAIESSKNKPFPSLNEQPDKPENTLNVAEKNREIRELEDLSKTHVQSREEALKNRSAAPVQEKKSDEGSIFGLGWLKSGKTKTSKANNKEGLTPPEKLRLSRVRSANPDVENPPDNYSTGSTSTPTLGSGLRTTPILPLVPEKKEKTTKLNAPEKPSPRDVGAGLRKDVGNLPTAQKPKMVLFSKGSRKLTRKQQKPLDEIAQFRESSGSILYVLGFSQTDPAAGSEVNIDSQDMAISRANYVAEGLRKRGFPADQVVVQIIDELTQKSQKPNPAMQRVEVYFESTQAAQIPVAPLPKRAAKKSALDFLKGKPFEYSESEN